MRRFAIIAAAAISMSVPAFAETKSLKCPSRWGKPAMPLIATQNAAEAIFIAVESDFFPRADKVRFPEVYARDEGKWWSVFRWDPPTPDPGTGEIILSAGGGQLSMRIDKCDGRIWHVYFTR